MLSIKGKHSIPYFPSFLLQGILGVYVCIREKKSFSLRRQLPLEED